jgi:hypothetical protein
MILPAGGEALDARRQAAAGPLRPLAVSLRRDLQPLIDASELFIPRDKARLTRLGGRCPNHGVLLEFDPWRPRAHRCSACGVDYTEDEHYRWWIMNYQLWLAERSVHAAALGLLTGDLDALALSQRILGAYASRYLEYENKDNVLGPTRVFFSTYLESIWLLQLASALGLLERAEAAGTLSGEVRERVLAPSAALIVEYDEGQSNRQVWNNAALLMAGAMLGDTAVCHRAVEGRSGLVAHLTNSLLADGTWYEGENYHLFAHRGLWYGVQGCAALGIALPDEALRRYGEGFTTPFATALPDLTFPARRDSQYAVSLRQWRTAESCELGLARGYDARLGSALARLYGDDLPEGVVGRARSTAEAERNLPATRLTRADLGWKALLFALPELPPADDLPPRSVHLTAQGFGILRRDAGSVYVALDYGTPGGGHGHPDRLNAWLVIGPHRILEDVGTGSYVERALFWYRSTLAHNAPLVDGRSQPYGSGRLRAWDERGGAGWIEADVDLVPGRVRATRRLIVMPDYMIDELHWNGADAATIDLPFHFEPDPDATQRWTPVPEPFQAEPGSGFEFVRRVEQRWDAGRPFAARIDRAGVRMWSDCTTAHAWFRAVAPGPPGATERTFLWVRARGTSGRLRTVWAWSPVVADVELAGEACTIQVRDGRHVHQLVDQRWAIALLLAEARSSIDLEGRVPGGEGQDALRDPVPAPPRHVLAPGRPFAMELGKRHYRRSEQPWETAGSPTATLRIALGRASVDVDVEVRKAEPYFAPARATNPLDNEDPDINSDGMQLYVYLPDSHAFSSWILVPEPASASVRIRPREAAGESLALDADWKPTADGYRIRCRLPRGPRGLGVDREVRLNVVVNEMSPDRERRRGQLVAAGAGDEWVYLRGDREDRDRMLAFEIVDG